MESNEVFKLDVNDWEKKCILYDKNRKGLNFEVTFRLEDGNAVVSFENLEEKYVNTIKKLLLSNIQGAILYLFEVFKPFYALKEDADSEYEKNFKIMTEYTEFYLRILATQGYTEFTSEVSKMTSFLHLKYEVNHTHFKDGVWKQGEGVWIDGKWEGDDTRNTIFSQSLWENIFI